MNYRFTQGFTLLELMVVVVIIALLSLIAFPSYQDYVRKTRRSEGQAFLLATQQSIERAYTDLNSYSAAASQVVGSAGITSENKYYKVTVATTPAATVTTYKINSSPMGAQSSDKCGTFSIDQTNAKSLSGNTLSTEECKWQ